MTLVTDLLDRSRQLMADKEPWNALFAEIAAYALPDAERFDRSFSGSRGMANKVAGSFTMNRSQTFASIVEGPVASERTKQIYDQTSIMAIDRGAAGTLSLVTPQIGTWHDLASDDPFAAEPSDAETRWYERLRDYLFAVRGNPISGFWTSHKAAMRAVWAFGTAVVYVENGKPGRTAPIRYHYMPLSECHLATDFTGMVDTNYRIFDLSARQVVQQFERDGLQKVSAKVRQMAADPKQMDTAVRILHAVQPRSEMGSRGNTNRESAFASYYVEIDQQHLIGEGGYFQFPYRVDHWQRNMTGPYAEGPIALALADIKSLNLLSMHALISAQQAVRPPMATVNDGIPRANFNPGAMNEGALDQQGNLLVKPMIIAQRPDFAESVLETKRNQIRETLYVNLWQILIQNRDMSATEAMIRANEKGDLLSPVGSSIQAGLAHMVDREVGILINRHAFDAGSPLEPPPSVRGKGIGVRFTSPLDRLRRLPEFQGMQQLVAFLGQLVPGYPDVVDKVNADNMVDEAQKILGAPRKVMATDDEVAAARQQRQTMQNMAAGTQAVQGAGDAGQSAVAALDAAGKTTSPVTQKVLQNLTSVLAKQPGIAVQPAGQ